MGPTESLPFFRAGKRNAKKFLTSNQGSEFWLQERTSTSEVSTRQQPYARRLRSKIISLRNVAVRAFGEKQSQ